MKDGSVGVLANSFFVGTGYIQEEADGKIIPYRSTKTRNAIIKENNILKVVVGGLAVASMILSVKLYTKSKN